GSATSPANPSRASSPAPLRPSSPKTSPGRGGCFGRRRSESCPRGTSPATDSLTSGPHGSPGSVPSRRSEVVRDQARRADAATGRRVAQDPRRKEHPHRGSDRFRQDPRRLSLRDRLPDSPGRGPARPDAGSLRVAAAGALQRRSEEPSGAAGRDRGDGSVGAGGPGAPPNRGYAVLGAHGDDETAAAHPGHDSRVALPSSDERRRAGNAPDRLDGDR